MRDVSRFDSQIDYWSVWICKFQVVRVCVQEGEIVRVTTRNLSTYPQRINRNRKEALIISYIRMHCIGCLVNLPSVKC